MRNVLVVDDAEDIRELLSTAFRSTFHANIYSARSGHEAIEVITLHAVDLIVTDLNMPNGSGLDVLDHLTKLHSTIPCILFTSVQAFQILKVENEYSAFLGVVDKTDLKGIFHLVHMHLGWRF